MFLIYVTNHGLMWGTAMFQDWDVCIASLFGVFVTCRLCLATAGGIFCLQYLTYIHPWCVYFV